MIPTVWPTEVHLWGGPFDGWIWSTAGAPYLATVQNPSKPLTVAEIQASPIAPWRLLPQKGDSMSLELCVTNADSTLHAHYRQTDDDEPFRYMRLESV